MNCKSWKEENGRQSIQPALVILAWMMLAVRHASKHVILREVVAASNA